MSGQDKKNEDKDRIISSMDFLECPECGQRYPKGSSCPECEKQKNNAD